MKFVADVMLGRLARLMRFAGYDVEYNSNAEDRLLLTKTRSRILLTKDRALADRVSENRVYFVESTGAENQLSEIQAKFPPVEGRTRCIICNRRIRPVRKSKVQHLVPPFVFKKHNEFFYCPECKRVYWPGTHFEHMTGMVK